MVCILMNLTLSSLNESILTNITAARTEQDSPRHIHRLSDVIFSVYASCSGTPLCRENYYKHYAALNSQIAKMVLAISFS